jgi:hypothetical protein
MKTQGISLVSTGQTSTRTASTSGTKTSSASFDSYMNTQTKNVKSANRTDAVQTADKPSKEDYVKVCGQWTGAC